MPDRESSPPPSSRDVAGEDFLFHLYRGSELLQDNRVHDAKVELEQALSLQPSDPKGQDLLGIVYFRLGMYPRAISIYERLIHAHPEAIEPRINLALSYLKTGQPAQARVELEKVLEQNSTHARAWGYLGLAFQRLGDYERASHAFAAGGHDAMARRVLDLSPGSALASEAFPGGAAEPRRASESFQELDRADVGLRPDIAAEPRVPSGMWASEPGLMEMPTVSRPSRPPPEPLYASRPPTPSIPARRASGMLATVTSPPPAEAGSPPPAADGRPALLQASPPARAAQLVRDLLLVFPRDINVALHASGLVLVQTTSSFVTRLEAVRSIIYPAGFSTTMLMRRMRGKTLEEPLGGASSPLFEIGGRGELVLGPLVGQRLLPLALESDPLYLREDAVSAFEPSVSYENGRLPVGDGDAISMVQLRGPGSVVVALPGATTALEITEGRSTAVRAITVLGWLGRVVPRALSSSEAPAGARGFVSFAGEGMVLVDAR